MTLSGHTPSRNKKLKLLFASFVIMGLCLYAILLLGDYAIKMIRTSQPSTARNIQSERVKQEDIPQRDEAIRNGFASMLLPSFIETYAPLENLAISKMVAPLAPKPHTKVYYCNEGYGLITYTTDRFGFRNNDEAWDQAVDLVLIGDSFTHGGCVSDKETTAGYLSTKYHVLNLGTSGNHPIHYASLVKTFIPLIKPKKIAIIFYANDRDNLREDSLYYDLYFIKNTNYFESGKMSGQAINDRVRDFYAEAEPIMQKIMSNQIQPMRNKSFMRGVTDRLMLVNISGELARIFSLQNPRKDKHPPFSSMFAIDTAVQYCKMYSCEPIFIYIPNSEFWEPNFHSLSYAKSLSDYSSKRQARFIDTTELLRPMGDEAYAPKGMHLSPSGYKRVGDEISRLIQSRY